MWSRIIDGQIGYLQTRGIIRPEPVIEPSNGEEEQDEVTFVRSITAAQARAERVSRTELIDLTLDED